MSVDNQSVFNPVSVKFHNDEIPAFIGNDNEIYAAANQVLRNIGFNEDRVKAIRKKWRDDKVISAKGWYFTLRYSGGVQPVDKDTYCLPHKILPLALAKISITPTLEADYPEVVEKLVAYQLECADVLYRHFFPQEVSVAETPLTREDLVYFCTYFAESAKEYFANFVNANAKFIDTFDQRLSVIEKGYTDVCGSYADMRESHTALTNGYNALKEGYATLMKGYTTANYKASMMEKAMTEFFGKIGGGVSTQANVVTTVNEAPSNPMFVNTLSYSKKKKWCDKFWLAAKIIGGARNKTKLAGLLDIYEVMRKNGVDVDGLHNEYKLSHLTKNSIACMIIGSDELRKSAEEAIRQLYEKYFPEKYGAKSKTDVKAESVTDVVAKSSSTVKKQYKSQLMLSTPPEVKKLIQTVADKRNVSYMKVAASVYSEVEKRAGVNLKECAKKMATSAGYMNCAKAYYISQCPDLMKVLAEIAA